MTSMHPHTSLKVGIVIGSQRVIRSCPQVAQFVLDILRSSFNKKHTPGLQIDFSLLDIADFELPLADIPSLPSHMKEADLPGSYESKSTQAWSSAVDSCDGFVFVTPQYNWGMPAALKNALDHIFHEFTGKPAMVIAYGGQAGTLSAAQLITVLSGMFVRVSKKPVCMKFTDKDMLFRSIKGDELGLNAASNDGTWADYKKGIEERWDEVLSLLVKGREKPTIRSLGLKQLWEDTVGDAYNVELKFITK